MLNARSIASNTSNFSRLVDIFRLFGGSCGLTPRRIAPQQRTQVPHSATGDSRKDALWGSHSHGKAHSACERSPRVRFSVTSPVQNALFRRVRFSSPAQTWSHLTQRRILRRRSHGKAHFACGPHQRARSACERRLRREAIFADLCTLLHTHGRSHDRAPGPEAHAAGAVTQPPTRAHEASIFHA